FQVNAANFGAAIDGRRGAGDRCDRTMQIGTRSRERSRRQRGRPMAGMKGRDSAHRLIAAVHEVGAVAAVDVQIDEAGDNQLVHGDAVGRCLRFGSHVHDLPLFDADERLVANLAANESASPQAPSHTLIFPRTVGRPPVAPGMFVFSPAMASLAMMARPMASFALLSMWKCSWRRIVHPGRRSASICMSVRFCEPPPPTMTSSIGPRGRMKSR